jgi:hypothetical protein
MTNGNLILRTIAGLSCLFSFSFPGEQAQQPASPEKPQYIRQLITLPAVVDALKRGMQDEMVDHVPTVSPFLFSGSLPAPRPVLPSEG